MSAVVFDPSRFVQAHTAMLELLDGNATENVLNEALTAMQTCLQQQFSKEEQAMQAVQFGPLEAHKKDHDGALQRLSARIELWQQTRDRQALMEYLEGPFADWFVRHVNSRDFITARHLSLA